MAQLNIYTCTMAQLNIHACTMSQLNIYACTMSQLNIYTCTILPDCITQMNISLFKLIYLNVIFYDVFSFFLSSILVLFLLISSVHCFSKTNFSDFSYVRYCMCQPKVHLYVCLLSTIIILRTQCVYINGIWVHVSSGLIVNIYLQCNTA